jgi:Leucine-rich repeat (LRR) protein
VLDLSNNDLAKLKAKSSGIELVSCLCMLTALETLDLSGNRLAADGVALLANLTALTTLRVLHLSGNRLLDLNPKPALNPKPYTLKQARGRGRGHAPSPLS